jgi:hypothetical protein
MTDPIEDALTHIQERCRVSWSENEIIELIEAVKVLRRQEKAGMLTLPVFDPNRMNVGERERWG